MDIATVLKPDRVRARATPGAGGRAARRMATWLVALAVQVIALIPASLAHSADSGATFPNRLLVAIPRHFPLQYMTEDNGKRTGFAIDVAEAVAKRAGVRFEYLPKDDWAQTIDALRRGEADIIPNLGITPEREKEFTFTRPMETFSIALFVRADSPEIHRLEDLTLHSVAVVKGNAARTLLANQAGLGLALVEYESLSEAILGLLSGGVDALAHPEPTVWLIAREAGLASRLRALEEPLKEIKRAMAVRRDRTALRDRLDRIMGALQASPEFHSLYIKWHGEARPWWQQDRLLLALGSLLLVSIIVILSRFLPTLRHNRQLRRELELKARIAQATSESEQRYRTLVENAPEAIAVLDMEAGHFIDCNNNFLELFKLDTESFLQANPLRVSPVQQPDGQTSERAVAKHLQQAVSGKQSTFEWLSQDMDGRQFPSEVRLVRLPSSTRTLIRGSLIDITERKTIEAELTSHRNHLADLVEERTRELEASNEEMKNFVYIVSHDLRAPLVNIKGFSHELRYNLQQLHDLIDPMLAHLDDQQRKHYARLVNEELPEAMLFIESSVTKMDKQINAVLKLSRTGQRELVPLEVDTNALVRRTLDTLAHQIDATHTRIEVTELPNVVADTTALEQIFGNLLDNAVKYLSPERPGLIRVCAASGCGETRFEVCDNGVGIATSDLGRIFLVFQRANTRGQPGDGMGLAYVQSLLRRMGGRIWCESRLAEGSCFHFTLPDQTAATLPDVFDAAEGAT